jgi:hypothetical protein
MNSWITAMMLEGIRSRFTLATSKSPPTIPAMNFEHFSSSFVRWKTVPSEQTSDHVVIPNETHLCLT